MCANEANEVRLSVPVTDRDHSEGPAAAPVTLVEYGDFECPHCHQAFPVVKEIQRRLGNKLRFVFRHLPHMQQHPHAELAAEAAEAAGAQGKFWEMYDYIFAHQDALEASHLHQYAEALGLDVQRFDQDLAAHRYVDRVREDFRGGIRSGVTSTPAFYINEVRYERAHTPERMLYAIEAAAG